MKNLLLNKLAGVCLYSILIMAIAYCQVPSKLANSDKHFVTEIRFTEDGSSLIELRAQPIVDLDSLGPLVHGKKHGEWVGFLDGNLVYREYYSFGKMVSGESFAASRIYRYNQNYMLPEPSTGTQVFLESIRSSTSYPELAQRAGHQGEVKVKLHFDDQGKLIQSQILKNFGFGIEPQIIKAIEETPGWSPGLVSGMPVKSSRIIVVRFRLVESMAV